MTGTYDPWLVTLSVVIAQLAAYVALDAGGRVTSSRGLVRSAWLCGGASAMGLGIWSMHYIGMLAYRMPMEVRYDIPLVVLSLLVAIVASAVALFVVSRPKMGRVALIVGGALIGAGIAGMHYIGMAAMRMLAVTRYSAQLVILSVALAVIVAIVALALTFAGRDEKNHTSWRKVISAVIMGSAIPLMHYTGMAAVSFTHTETPAPLLQGVSIRSHDLAVIVGLSVGVLVFAIVAALLDRTLAAQRLNEEAQLRFARRTAERDQHFQQQIRLKDEFLANELKQRDEVLSTVSHELRTPLASIIQLTDILRDETAGPLSRDQKECLQAISQSAAILESLISDLLDATRARTGKLKLATKPLSLVRSVRSVFNSLRWTASAKRLNLSGEVEEGCLMAFADPARVQQILVNLIHNAIKFTPEGGSIHVRVGKSASDPRLLQVDVIDTGAGLSAFARERVFERLYQAEDGERLDSSGLGLGLFICRELIQRQGGTIWVESEAGVGSTFSFTLPSSDRVDSGLAEEGGMSGVLELRAS